MVAHEKYMYLIFSHGYIPVSYTHLEVEKESKNWDYGIKLPRKEEKVNTHTIKGSQFAKPYIEFSGACAGCGETPYIKLVTQLFGDRMMIANATGCSSIWGASAPSMPYCKDENGRGPAWANSLFEDNAEYGYGMVMADKQLRNKLEEMMRELLELDADEALKTAMTEWIEYKNDGSETREKSDNVIAAIANLKSDDARVKELCGKIMEFKDHLVKKSFWALGGDGWAYDIRCV